MRQTVKTQNDLKRFVAAVHEWLANKNYIYDEDSKAEKSYKKFVDNQGEYPYGEEHMWDNTKPIRKRVLSVLEKYSHYKKVIVAFHRMMIQAVTKKCHPNNGEIIEFEL